MGEGNSNVPTWKQNAINTRKTDDIIAEAGTVSQIIDGVKSVDEILGKDQEPGVVNNKNNSL